MELPLDLGLKLPAPEVTPEQVEQLVAVLVIGAKTEPKNERERKRIEAGWMTAEEIAAQIPDATERSVRRIASAAAPAVVSFPGSPGYKIWAKCSVDEINHAIEAFESQARDMIKRAHLFRQAYHRRFRASS